MCRRCAGVSLWIRFTRPPKLWKTERSEEREKENKQRATYTSLSPPPLPSSAPSACPHFSPPRFLSSLAYVASVIGVAPSTSRPSCVRVPVLSKHMRSMRPHTFTLRRERGMRARSERRERKPGERKKRRRENRERRDREYVVK